MALQQNMNLLDEVMKVGPGNQAAKDTDQTQLATQVNKGGGESAQQLGAMMASSAGQASLARTQAVVQEKAGLSQQGLQRQQLGAQTSASNRELAYDQLASKNSNALFSLGQEVGNQINYANRQFALDEANQKYMNQQMLDQYMVEKATSQEDLNNFVAQTEQNYQRKAQLMDRMSKSLTQALNQGFIKEQGDLDNKSKEAITRLKVAYDQAKLDALKQANATAAKRQLIVGAFSAVGTVAGGIVGAVYGGGPAGAMVGGAAGGAVGGFAGTAAAQTLAPDNQ